MLQNIFMLQDIPNDYISALLLDSFSIVTLIWAKPHLYFRGSFSSKIQVVQDM